MIFLLKKMLRDIKTNWMQFVTVFLMSVLSVTIFSGMASVWNGMDKEVSRYSKETNLANIWVYGENLDRSDEDKLKDIDGVEDVTLSTSIPVSLKSGGQNLLITAPDNDKCIKPITESGEKWNCEEDGIWLDKSFAEANDIKNGDKITVEFKGHDTELEVKGTVLHSEYIYYTGSVTESIPNHEEYGYGFISRDSLKKMIGADIYTEARIRTDKAVSTEKIEDALGDKYRGSRTREDMPSFEQVRKESLQMKKMSMLFSAVFIMLALLTMYTSMVRLISNQIVLIGTMKALGIKSRNIRIHYALYGFILPLIGGAVGLLLGRAFVSKALLKVKQSTLTLPVWTLEHSELSFALIVIIILICMLASIWASGKGLKGMPAETMRGEIGKIEAKTNIFEKAPCIWNRISYYWRWVFRDISRNKARFIMGIIGVVGGLVLIISGVGIRDSIIYSNAYVFDKQYAYDARGVLSVPGQKPEIDADTQYAFQGEVYIKNASDSSLEKKGVITACEPGDLLRYNDNADKKIDIEKAGVLMNRKIAGQLNIKAGDEVELRVQGSQDWKTVKIDRLTKNLNPQGISLSDEKYEEIFGSYAPNTVMVKGMSESELKDIDGISTAISKERQIDNMNFILESVMSIVKLLIMASVLLSVVILYNLGELNFIERTREYATLKVLGFYQSEIRGIAIKDCILSTLIGWLIGIPAGIQFLKLYVKTVSFDNFEWLTEVRPLTLLISTVVIVGTSIIINLILSAKVRKIDMVQALKSVE